MNDLDNILISHAERFYRVAFHLLESREDAEDAVQELYLKLWKFPPDPHRLRSPLAYGLALLKNICIDRIRRREIRKTEALDIGLSVEIPPPDQRIAAKSLLKRVMAEIDNLPERQAEVMKLLILEDEDYAGISARTGLSQVYVRVLVSMARKKLKQRIMI